MLDLFKNGRLGIVVNYDREIVKRLKKYLMPLKWQTGHSINSELIDDYLKEEGPIVLMHDTAVWYGRIKEFEMEHDETPLVTAAEFLNDRRLEIDDKDFMLLIGE